MMKKKYQVASPYFSFSLNLSGSLCLYLSLALSLSLSLSVSLLSVTTTGDLSVDSQPLEFKVRDLNKSFTCTFDSYFLGFFGLVLI